MSLVSQLGENAALVLSSWAFTGLLKQAQLPERLAHLSSLCSGHWGNTSGAEEPPLLPAVLTPCSLGRRNPGAGKQGGARVW